MRNVEQVTQASEKGETSVAEHVGHHDVSAQLPELRNAFQVGVLLGLLEGARFEISRETPLRVKSFRFGFWWMNHSILEVKLSTGLRVFVYRITAVLGELQGNREVVVRGV